MSNIQVEIDEGLLRWVNGYLQKQVNKNEFNCCDFNEGCKEKAREFICFAENTLNGVDDARKDSL